MRGVRRYRRETGMRWLDKVPVLPLAIAAVLLGLAPFSPRPHLVDKLALLVAGELTRPVDLFDLVLHASLPLLLGLKLIRGWRS
jgi:hypothetical protein